MDPSAELPQTKCAQIDDQNNPTNVESELPKSRILEELEILPPGCMPNNSTDTEEKPDINDLEFVDDVISFDDQGTISGDDKYQRASPSGTHADVESFSSSDKVGPNIVSPPTSGRAQSVPETPKATWSVMTLPASTSAHQIGASRIRSPTGSLPAMRTSTATSKSGRPPIVQVTTIDETVVITRPSISSSTTSSTPKPKSLNDWHASLTHMPAPRSMSVTSSISLGDMCRICHCESTVETPLISPCHCAGSLRYVHQHCLQTWIKSSQTKSCEVCRYQFIMQSKTKPLRKWESLKMTRVERRRWLCSMTFHLFAITCVSWSLFVLGQRLVNDVLNKDFKWEFWTKLVIVIVGGVGAIIFVIIQCKSYGRLCLRWKAFNKVVYVQDCPDLKPRSAPPVQSLGRRGKKKKSADKGGNHRTRVAAAS